jgi:myo-inositol 2-dehydrogenase/D-chiro-inositol 1-dehydrogenase
VGLNLKTPIHDIEGEIGFSAIRYSGFIERFRQAFAEESHAFIKFVDGKTANPCPPINARQALRVAIACEESISSGAAIKVL